MGLASAWMDCCLQFSLTLGPLRHQLSSLNDLYCVFILQDLEGLLAAFDEERRVMGERHAAAEERAAQLQAQVGSGWLLLCRTHCLDAAAGACILLVSRRR
jgi:hypothetical protein